MSDKKLRGLDDEFISDLKIGQLKQFLELVNNDHTLCLEIRANYLNIYYRGGSIFKISKTNGNYEINFDNKYLRKDTPTIKYIQSMNSKDYDAWLDQVPFIKKEIDFYYVNIKDPSEREFQQLILRENNFGKYANGTDFYFSDIEYADSSNKSRFDMIGVEWLSKPNIRKKGDQCRLTFFEVKYGDNALNKSKSGILSHVDDIWKFVNDPNKMADIKTETESIINQKVYLELIYGIKKSISISTEKPQFIFIFANHKPASTILNEELVKIINLPYYEDLKSLIDINIVNSIFMGYGLYKSGIIGLEDYLKKPILAT